MAGRPTRNFSFPPSQAFGRAVAAIVVASFLACLVACAKSSDREAYEEVVASMSLVKAKRFFADYPNSPYLDRLADQIIEWCRQEPTEEILRAALETLPKDHPRRKDIEDIYTKRFGIRP
jgi:hypothetical protein